MTAARLDRILWPQIPTPEEVDKNKVVTAAGLAVSLKHRIIAALQRGEFSVGLDSGMDNPEVFKLIERDFEEAGWQVLNHGVSASVRKRV